MFFRSFLNGVVVLIGISLPVLQPTTANADLIAGVTVHDVSSELTSFDQYASYVVDGSGLSGDVHTTYGHGTMWLNTGNGYFGGTPGPDPTNPGGVGATITFDLANSYNLTEMRVWNFTHLGGTNRSANFVSVYSAPDLSSAFQLVGDYNFVKPSYTGSNFTGDLYKLEVSGARLIKFHIASNHATNRDGLVGLAEVQFFGLPSVPEPSSAILLGGALLASLFRRHERRQVD